MENQNHIWSLWDDVAISTPIIIYVILILFVCYCVFNLYRKLCKVLDSLSRYLDSHTKKE